MKAGVAGVGSTNLSDAPFLSVRTTKLLQADLAVFLAPDLWRDSYRGRVRASGEGREGEPLGRMLRSGRLIICAWRLPHEDRVPQHPEEAGVLLLTPVSFLRAGLDDSSFQCRRSGQATRTEGKPGRKEKCRARIVHTLLVFLFVFMYTIDTNGRRH